MTVAKKHRSTRTEVAAYVLAGALLAPAGIAFSQDQKPAVLFEHHGFSSFMVDEKDQAFRRALGMLPARLWELRAELPELREIPEPALSLALDLAPRPMRFAILPVGMDPATGAPSVSVALSIRAESAEDAGSISDRLMELLELTGTDLRFESLPDDPAQRQLATPAGPLLFGPARDQVGWSFRISFGPALDLDAAFAALEPWPAGVSPVMRGRVDMQVLSPFLSMAIGLAGGHEGQMALAQLGRLGILGPDAVALEFAYAYSEDAALARYVFERAGLAEGAGYVKTPLGRDAFRIVPRDASVLAISQWDASSVWGMLESLAVYNPDIDLGAAREWSRELLGVDIKTDLLDPLGTTWCWYNSDTTGGDSPLAGVLAVSLDDETRFRGAVEKLEALANDKLADMPYVRFAQQELWGERIHMVQIRGLPIPLELSYAIEGGQFLMTMTPQAACAAVRQIRQGGDSILDNPVFRRSAPEEGMDRLVGYTYMDTEKLARCGYPLMQLAGAAVGNAMRSPHGEREPGVLVPMYNDFIANVNPTVMVAYWDGDDLIQEMRGDRSLLVNTAAAVGSLGRSPIVPTIIGGAIMGAGAGFLHEVGLDIGRVGQRPGFDDRQRVTQSESQVRRIVVAMIIYVTDHEVKSPSVQELIPRYLDQDVLRSPFGPVGDDEGDYLLRADVDLSQIQEPWSVVAVYDRAMFLHHDRVAVGFIDGHVRVLSTEEFLELLGSQQNRDYDWKLPVL